MRCIIVLLTLLGTLSGQTPSLQDLAALRGQAGSTTIYTAKAFLTMDAKLSRAEAIAVRDGRFIAIGKLAEVQTASGKEAKVDRTFADRVVVAGFVEQHVHPVLAALTMNTKVISIEDWDAIDGFSPAVRDPEGYQLRLKKALKEHLDKSKPFVTWGYHHYMHGELNRRILNVLASDFPMIVWHRSTHEFYLNDLALKLTGIDAELVARLPKSAQGQIDFERGHFYEQGAMAVLDKLAPVLASPAAFKNGLEFTVKYYHNNGITVACEPGGFFSKPMQDLINDCYSGNDVPFNHFFIPDGKTFAAKHPKDARAMVSDCEQVLNWGKGRTAFLPKQVKLFTDGAIFSQLMQM
jgi:predicted amidohydrolase YtcJ